MASYPNSIKIFTVKTNKVDLVDAAHINAVQDEITAEQTELGTLIKGSCADLKARLAVSLADDGAVAKGTSFPASPIAFQLFGRTDEDILYYRNAANTGWLTPVTGWNKISDQALSAVVSVTISGLNGDAEKNYKILLQGSCSASGNVILFTINGDTTENNYRRVFHIVRGTTDPPTVFMERGSNRQIIATYTNGKYNTEINLSAISGRERCAIVGTAALDDTPNCYIQTATLVWLNTADNITSITLNFPANFTGRIILFGVK